MIHEDKRGEAVYLHSIVNVDEPTGVWACHQNAFTGTVVNIGNLFITVEDQDGECFDVPAEHLEVVIPDDGTPFEYEPDEQLCPDCGIGILRVGMVDDNVGHGIHEELYCTDCGPK